MRYIIQFFIIFFLPFTSISALTCTKQLAWVKGPDWIEDINAKYQNGDYSEFLKKMDLCFAKDLQKEPERDCPFNMEETVTQKLIPLMQETKMQLLAIAESTSDADLAAIIFGAYKTETLSEQEKKEWEFLVQLAFPEEKEQKGVLAKLQNIVQEGLDKKAILTGICNQIVDYPEMGEINKSYLEEYCAVIQIATLNKLISTAFEDKELYSKVKGFLEINKVLAASKHDWRYLVLLGKGTRFPRNNSEYEVARIMEAFLQQKKAALLM